MGMFFDNDPASKPHVSKEEFHKARNELYGQGFSHKQLDQVDMVFRGDFDETRKEDKFLSHNEIDKGIQWLKDNKGHHDIDEHKIDILEKTLKRKL